MTREEYSDEAYRLLQQLTEKARDPNFSPTRIGEGFKKWIAMNDALTNGDTDKWERATG